jgi:signal recognition particle subunit SRP54
MAFEGLSERLQGIFKKIKGDSVLSERNMSPVFEEIRIALLEADVNYKVVKDFIQRLRGKIIGTKVLAALSPQQMVIKLVNEELTNLLGSEQADIKFAHHTTIMMVGLQGSGKTTTVAKLAALIKKKYQKSVLLVALDIYRPGAIEQLEQLGTQINAPVYQEKNNKDPVNIAKNALEYAKINHFDTVILDTAGRLAIDEPLMEELENIKYYTTPNEILLVVDALSGQDAYNTANIFYERLAITGIVMTKLDGSSRGGAALSIRHLTGVPLKFIGVGEKIEDIEIFYPERMSERILGMGDVLTLIDKAVENMDQKKVEKFMNRMMQGLFDYEDMLVQMEQVRKMGSFSGLLKLIPGAPKVTNEQKTEIEKNLKVTRAIISSMTMKERRNPSLINNLSRKERIAKGSGRTINEINKLQKQYEQAYAQMKQMGSMLKQGKRPF